jgi:hypothetical protein
MLIGYVNQKSAQAMAGNDTEEHSGEERKLLSLNTRGCIYVLLGASRFSFLPALSQCLICKY